MLRTARELVHGELSGRVIQAAIAVHSHLGPGLLESVYRSCLVHELSLDGMAARVEVPVSVSYRNSTLDCGFRADIIVDDALVLELKACEEILPIHRAQLLTYLKLTNLRVGLLLNFNSTSMRQGIRRVVL